MAVPALLHSKKKNVKELGAADVMFWKSVTGRTLGDRNDKEIRKE
jgi:hypothetical protein